MSISLRRALKHSPSEIVKLTRRELACRTAARTMERRLAWAERNKAPVLVGPFLGEIGYELLYWIPLLRQRLAEAGIPPDRVIALTRGGAGCWYTDFAGTSIEVLDLIEPVEFHARLLERRAWAGDAKQLTVASFDRQLAAQALDQIPGAAVIHPAIMYASLRHAWRGREPLAKLLAALRFRPLPKPHARAPYVVLKAYFSDCFPDTLKNREYLEGLIAQLAAEIEVRVLVSTVTLDEHDEWHPEIRANVTTIELDPHDNLAAQTAAVTGASGLISTYGGFSYLGAFGGVPTLTFQSEPDFNPVHLDVLKAARPAAQYVKTYTHERAGVERFLEGLALPTERPA